MKYVNFYQNGKYDFKKITHTILGYRIGSAKGDIIRNHFGKMEQIKEKCFDLYNSTNKNGKNFFDITIPSLSGVLYIYEPKPKVSIGYLKSNCSIHHQCPICCGGENTLENLVPLPIGFHEWYHAEIYDPQIKGTYPGEEIELKGMLDFEKLTLGILMDHEFQSQYVDYLHQELGVPYLQPKAKKITTQDDKNKYIARHSYLQKKQEKKLEKKRLLVIQAKRAFFSPDLE